MNGGPEAEFVVEVLAGVDPVGGEAPACAAHGLRPRSGGVGLLRTGDEDGVEGDDEWWGFPPRPLVGGVGGSAPHFAIFLGGRSKIKSEAKENEKKRK